MKKIMSSFLAIAFAFCAIFLTSCENEGTPEPVETPHVSQAAPSAEPEQKSDEITEEMLLSSKPNEYIREKLDAGMEVTVAMSFVSLGDGYTTMLDEGFRATFENEGMTYASSGAETNLATQLTHIENYVSMSCALVMVLASDADALFDIATRASEQGTYILLMGQQSPNPVICSVSQDAAQIGRAYANLALTWVDKAYADAPAGSVHYSSLEGRGAQEAIIRFDTMNETLEADPRLYHGYMKTGAAKTVDNGYLFAEESLTADPDVVLFITMTSTEAIGVNNYLISQPGLDLDKMMILGGDITEEGKALVDQSELNDGTSLVRGIIGFGGATPYATTAEVALELLYGIIQPPMSYTDPVWSYDVVGFNYSSAEQ